MEAATDGAATTGTGGAMEDDPEPPPAAADIPAPPYTGGPPDEEEPEATGLPDGPTPPCPAIHAPGPVDGTLPLCRYHHKHNKVKYRDR